MYSEFKHFFPKNLVEYFVSYYDYYQPEAYIPSSGIYIEKDLSINDEIEYRFVPSPHLILKNSPNNIVGSKLQNKFNKKEIYKCDDCGSLCNTCNIEVQDSRCKDLHVNY